MELGMTGPAESIPVMDPEGGEAASVWRTDKLKDFDWRLRCLGLDQDPVFQDLLSQIGEHTVAVEQLWQEQRKPGYVKPWWADGEYDDSRADSANDEGMRLLAEGKLSEAFGCFTEAIRLRPTSPVYHCNRAVVCLRLKRPELAAEDAANAIQRDGRYLKAYLRGGRARLLLEQPTEALELFKQALELDDGNAAAKKGVAEAEALARRQQQQHAEELAAAQLGSRPGLPRGLVPEVEAAEQLYMAAQMLAANPRLQAARCSHVEGLILCQRYREAAAECEGLLEGVDRLYLQAEVAWRQGDLEGAVAGLDEALALAAACTKCAQLREFLGRLEAVWWDAELAKEDSALQRCAECCAELLSAFQAAAAPGLYCRVLHLRAEAHGARGLWGEAVQDLDAALQVDANHAACLQLRAEAHRHMGAYMDSVLDLQRLQKVAPGTPGLFAMLQQAAKLCLGGRQQQRGGRRGGGAGGGTGGGAPGGGGQDAFAALGLSPSATSAQVRRAYLKLAAKWHPDKWAGGLEEERQAAEAKFKEVQKAYEALTG